MRAILGNRGAGDRRPAVSLRLTDSVVFAFALWTVCSHAVVALGGTILTLLLVFTTTAVGALAVMTVRKPRRGEPRPAVRAGRPPPPRPILQTLGAAGALTGGVLLTVTKDPFLFWWWGVVCLSAAGVAVLLLERPRPMSSAGGRWRERMLLVLAALCVVVTLVSHRQDTDDAYYLSFAVTAADHPDWPLLDHENLHGVREIPLHLEVYRLHSYELLLGAVSLLTGWPVIYCFHWVAAAAGAFLVPLALARLFRHLTPRVWLPAVTVVLVVLISTGEVHRWYGNFAFVRIWQGKSMALFVFLPLIYAYALEFGLRPSRRGWLLLSAAQVAAVGATSTAVWLAPVSAWTALCCVLRPTFPGFRALVAGVLTSVYSLAGGWLLRGEVMSQLSIANEHDFGALGDPLRGASAVVLGDGRLLVFAAVSVLLAWAACPPGGLARRFAVGLPLAVWAILLNPYLAPWLARHVLGIPTYWRSFWALPVPFLMALVLIAPLHLRGFRHRQTRRWTVFLLVAAYVLFIPRYSGLSQANRTRLHAPGPKVRPNSYLMAQALTRAVPPRSYVVAPPEVAMWIPTFHDHPFPLKVLHYLDLPKVRRILGEESYKARRFMTRYAGAKADARQDHESFRRGLDRFSITGVCLRRTNPPGETPQVLESAGFQRVDELWLYEIWVHRSRARRMGWHPGVELKPGDDAAREPGADAAPIFSEGFESGDTSAWEK